MLHGRIQGVAVRAVFFDFMGTLARFVPEQEELLAAAARSLGLDVSPQQARRGFALGGDWWSRELANRPFESRTSAERDALYREFDRRVLEAAGLELAAEAAYEVFRELMRRGRGSELKLYDDALPVLDRLLYRGAITGLVSNMGPRLPAILENLGLDGRLQVVTYSGEAGASKPDPRIFRVAMERAGVAAAEAWFIGDQYENDVVGARGAGLLPALLDRHDLFPEVEDCQRIRSLTEVERLLDGEA